MSSLRPGEKARYFDGPAGDIVDDMIGVGVRVRTEPLQKRAIDGTLHCAQRQPFFLHAGGEAVPHRFRALAFFLGASVTA